MKGRGPGTPGQNCTTAFFFSTSPSSLPREAADRQADWDFPGNRMTSKQIKLETQRLKSPTVFSNSDSVLLFIQ